MSNDKARGETVAWQSERPRTSTRQADMLLRPALAATLLVLLAAAAGTGLITFGFGVCANRSHRLRQRALVLTGELRLIRLVALHLAVESFFARIRSFGHRVSSQSRFRALRQPMGPITNQAVTTRPRLILPAIHAPVNRQTQTELCGPDPGGAPWNHGSRFRRSGISSESPATRPSFPNRSPRTSTTNR